MRASGKIDLVTLMLLLAVAAAIWGLILFAPVYLDNFNVKDVVRGAYADAVLGKSDDSLRSRILDEVNTMKVGTHREVDRFGNVAIVPGLGLTAEHITIDRNEVAGTIRIRVDYSRPVRLTPLQKVVNVTFNVEKKGPLKP